MVTVLLVMGQTAMQIHVDITATGRNIESFVLALAVQATIAKNRLLFIITRNKSLYYHRIKY